MYYLKVFIDFLGMGEWAPPFFGASSATPLGGLWRVCVCLMGLWGDRNPVDTRLCTGSGL